MISVVLGFHLCVSRRSLQLTLALVCLCWLGCFLLVSVGELIFDLFLTSSNNLTATVESNAATEKKEVLWPFRFPWYRMQVTKATEKKKTIPTHQKVLHPTTKWQTSSDRRRCRWRPKPAESGWL